MSKTVLVLGGTGGVGGEVIQNLSRDYKVFATYLKNASRASTLQSLATMVKCDVRDQGQVEKLASKFKDVSVVINTLTPAIVLKKFQDTTAKEFDEILDTLVKGTANVYREIIPLMTSTPVLVHVSSVTAIEKFVDRMCVYAVAKTALARLHDYLAAELKSSLRVVTLTPHFIETKALAVFPSKLLELERMKMPGNEFIQPKDLAQLIRRVVENNARYPNGTNLILKNNVDVNNA